jgi:hypothetical protein
MPAARRQGEAEAFEAPSRRFEIPDAEEAVIDAG